MPRFRIEPRDVPATAAARLMGMDERRFVEALPNLLERGFPRPDPDTGNYDATAINRWCDARHPQIFGASAPLGARDARDVVGTRLAAMRARHGQG